MQSPLPSVVVAAAFVVIGLLKSRSEEEQEKTSFEQKSYFANVRFLSFDFPVFCCLLLFMIMIAT